MAGLDPAIHAVPPPQALTPERASTAASIPAQILSAYGACPGHPRRPARATLRNAAPDLHPNPALNHALDRRYGICSYTPHVLPPTQPRQRQPRQRQPRQRQPRSANPGSANPGNATPGNAAPAQPTRAERHLAALDELLEMAMQFARHLTRDIAAQHPAEAHLPDNGHRIQTTIAFHHVARAIRRITLVARKLEEPIPTTPPTPHAKAAPAGASPATSAAAELPVQPERTSRDRISPERIDALDRLPGRVGVAELPIPEIVAAIRKDLDLAKTLRPLVPHPLVPQPDPNPTPNAPRPYEPGAG